MSQDDLKKKAKKAAMKELRSARREWINKATAKVREQRKDLKAIRGHLEKSPATVPQIAEATGISSDRVLWYLAALKKYGQINESEKDGSYFRYMLTEKGLMGDSEDQEHAATLSRTA